MSASPAVVAGLLAPHVGLTAVVNGYAVLVVLAGGAGLVQGGIERRRAVTTLPVQRLRRVARDDTEAASRS